MGFLHHGHQALTASASQLVLLDLPDSLVQVLFNLSQQMDALVQQQLSGELVSSLRGVHTVTLVGCSASGNLSCRCWTSHFCCGAFGWPAHKPVALHSQYIAPDHRLHRWLQRFRE